MLILANASAKVPIAGINMKCGNLSGAIAKSANKVALKKTEIVIRIGLIPFLVDFSELGCHALSAIIMNASSHP